MVFSLNLPSQVKGRGALKKTCSTIMMATMKVAATGELAVKAMNYRVLVIMLQNQPDAQWEGPFNVLASHMPTMPHYTFHDTYKPDKASLTSTLGRPWG